MPMPGPGWGYSSARGSFAQARARAVVRWWTKAKAWGAIGHHSDHAKRFGAFGEGSIIMFPWNTLYGEKWMRIGKNTMIGEGVTLSVGIHPDQIPVSNPALTIGDRCLINKGTAIVAHFAIEIGDDVFTGHNCYITDQNHGYEDLTQPIGAQSMPEKPVRIGSGSWLGHGVIVVPGVTIGKHVTVAGGSVVTRDVPDRCVVAGAPARIVRRYVEGEGWVSVDRT
jgi:acetyltransferase-like isoleucine patch superfamily enzyme